MSFWNWLLGIPEKPEYAEDIEDGMSGQPITEIGAQVRAEMGGRYSDKAAEKRPRATIVHRGNVPWYQAPLPRRWHRCTGQTRGILSGRLIERCACGAVRLDRRYWINRNSRVKRFENAIPGPGPIQMPPVPPPPIARSPFTTPARLREPF